MEIPAERYRAILVDTLQLLARSAEQQIRAFPSFVHIPDELALTFDNVFGAVRANLVVDGLLEEPAWSTICEIDRLFEEMTDAYQRGDRNIWTTEEVRRAPEWADIRRLATLALAELGEAPCDPDTSWNIYVGGPK